VDSDEAKAAGSVIKKLQRGVAREKRKKLEGEDHAATIDDIPESAKINPPASNS
jgi:hypothetical protein